MAHNLQNSIILLDRTPAALNTLLRDLPEEWTFPNEGANTWSVFDVIGHLIHGERTDWMIRAARSTASIVLPRSAKARAKLCRGCSMNLHCCVRKTSPNCGHSISRRRIYRSAVSTRLSERSPCRNCWQPGLLTTLLMFIRFRESWPTNTATPWALGANSWASCNAPATAPRLSPHRRSNCRRTSLSECRRRRLSRSKLRSRSASPQTPRSAKLRLAVRLPGRLSGETSATTIRLATPPSAPKTAHR